MQNLILECAVRAFLIAICMGAVLSVLRVKAPRVRHAVWAGVVVLMLALPLWTAWGPRTAVRVLSPVTAPAVNRSIVSADAISGQAAAPPVRGLTWTWQSWLAAIYLLGFCALMARLAIGTARAYMLVRGAANREGRPTSDSCAAPVTAGWLNPTVILPEHWRQWPQAQLRAVLTHEEEHARWRDPLVQWLALLNRAVFWFHPLAWWLERRLSALAEEACDAAVLARGHDPFQYSEYLLEIARAMRQAGARVSVIGMAMPGAFLPQRIRRILGRASGPADFARAHGVRRYGLRRGFYRIHRGRDGSCASANQSAVRHKPTAASHPTRPRTATREADRIAGPGADEPPEAECGFAGWRIDFGYGGGPQRRARAGLSRRHAQSKRREREYHA